MDENDILHFHWSIRKTDLALVKKSTNRMKEHIIFFISTVFLCFDVQIMMKIAKLRIV